MLNLIKEFLVGPIVHSKITKNKDEKTYVMSFGETITSTFIRMVSSLDRTSIRLYSFVNSILVLKEMVSVSPDLFYFTNFATLILFYTDFILFFKRYVRDVSLFPSFLMIGVLHVSDGYLSTQGGNSICSYFIVIRALKTLATILQGLFRCLNKDYCDFLTTENRIRSYNYEMKYEPHTDDVNDISMERIKKYRIPSTKCQLHAQNSQDKSIISYLIAHIVGRRMIFPGSLKVTNYVANSQIIANRTAILMANESANRFRLKTFQECLVTEKKIKPINLDCMFVDRRNDSPRGSHLMICIEGNSGFYEVGIFNNTALLTQFSILGFNYPGFADSTGIPTMEYLWNSMDSIMNFALFKLEFPIEKIHILSWSIGGYLASYAAAFYPAIPSLTLDAPFQDILPLALQVMPPNLKEIVTKAIRQYYNLNNTELLICYKGPIFFIRRLSDEILSLKPGLLTANQTNPLVDDMLNYRFPSIFNNTTNFLLMWQNRPIKDDMKSKEEVQRWLSTTKNEKIWKDLRQATDFPYALELQTNENTILSYKVMDEYVMDFDSSHCTTLPTSYLRGIHNLVNGETN
ncbi:hypothetical protein SNEBB_001360 [Seison nebaliae]|nr:hypothetical protein SNEBB_001360 [Seison nebaliae]